MIRSRERHSDIRSLPFSVGVGCVTSGEYAVPHCSRSPFSVMAAPKFLSSLMSRNNRPSKNGILLGDLMRVSFESGATTFPVFEPHAYTPGFSQLRLTCRCCELIKSRFSSFDKPFFLLDFSIFTSAGAEGVSACASRRPNLLEPWKRAVPAPAASTKPMTWTFLWRVGTAVECPLIRRHWHRCLQLLDAL